MSDFFVFPLKIKFIFLDSRLSIYFRIIIRSVLTELGSSASRSEFIWLFELQLSPVSWYVYQCHQLINVQLDLSWLLLCDILLLFLRRSWSKNILHVWQYNCTQVQWVWGIQFALTQFMLSSPAILFDLYQWPFGKYRQALRQRWEDWRFSKVNDHLQHNV